MVSKLVAKGEIDLGMVVITQIMTTLGVKPAPRAAPVRYSVVHHVYWRRRSANANRLPARELLKFLQGPNALPVIKSQTRATEVCQLTYRARSPAYL